MGGPMFQTHRMTTVTNQRMKDNSWVQVKTTCPYYNSLPLTMLNTVKPELFLPHAHIVGQGKPKLQSRPLGTQCANLKQPVLCNCGTHASVIHNHGKIYFYVELCRISTIYVISALLTQGKEIPTHFFIWQLPLGTQFLSLLLLELCHFVPELISLGP